MDTEELITVSSRRGEGLSSYGVKYYIWNDSLVFPDEYEGFCIAKLDGSGEYIEEFVTGKSYTMIGDSIYAANGKIEELNLKTGQVRHFDDIEGYYSGTLTIYDEKFILLRYEAAYIGGTPADDKTIYSFPIADYQ